MNSKTVTASAVHPATFNLDCLDHLCQLENNLSGVRSEAGKGPSVAKLDALLEVLATISQFAEPRFSQPSYNNLANRIHKIYQATNDVEDLLKSASWTSLKRLFGQRPADNSNQAVLQAYEQLNADTKLLLVEFFVTCVKRFGTDPNDKRAFLESVDVFIHEFDRIWN